MIGFTEHISSITAYSIGISNILSMGSWYNSIKEETDVTDGCLRLKNEDFLDVSES